ncbi:hypothetical protein TNCV_3200301 [Trichonephila clavipes]|nr:hypothetical protein TNCV_3200301 [Trichonephila clavipes]
MSSLEQRAYIKLCILLEKSPSETFEMLKKVYGNDSSTRGFLSVSMAENEIEGVGDVDSDEVQGSNTGLGKVDSAVHPFSGLINEYRACLGTEHYGFRVRDHLAETSANAPPAPMVT